MRRSPVSRFAIMGVLLCCGAVAAFLSWRAAAEPPPSRGFGTEPQNLLPASVYSVELLVEQAEYIGVISVRPSSSYPNGSWQQTINVTTSEPVKGVLPLSNREWPRFETVWGFSAIRLNSFPDWYPDRGEYLVFLRRGSNEGKTVWTTLAAFPVSYRPSGLSQLNTGVAASGSRLIPGVSGSRYDMNRPAVSTSILLPLLKQVINGSGSKSSDASPRVKAAAHTLFSFFRAFRAGATPRSGLAHETLYRQAVHFVAMLPAGLTRAEIHRIFPQEDGGVSSPDRKRYYLGSQVMAEVRFERGAEQWGGPDDRVTGPIKVYKSLMHVD